MNRTRIILWLRRRAAWLGKRPWLFDAGVAAALAGVALLCPFPPEQSLLRFAYGLGAVGGGVAAYLGRQVSLGRLPAPEPAHRALAGGITVSFALAVICLALALGGGTWPAGLRAGLWGGALMSGLACARYLAAAKARWRQDRRARAR
jgi:hypothetical protein